VYYLIVVADMHQACKLQYLSRAVACARSLSLSSHIARARARSLSLSLSLAWAFSLALEFCVFSPIFIFARAALRRCSGRRGRGMSLCLSFFLFLYVSFFLSFSFSRTLSRSFTFSRTALRRCRRRGGRRRAGADWRVVSDVGLSCKSAQT